MGEVCARTGVGGLGTGRGASQLQQSENYDPVHWVPRLASTHYLPHAQNQMPTLVRVLTQFYREQAHLIK